MARMRRRLLDDFIIPALNSERYPDKLFWVHKEKGIFRIFWYHKNAAKWKAEDTIVFQDWDRLKGHFKPEGKNYFMSAKQRFRAALYKLSNYVRALPSPNKLYRNYQLINERECKRRNENLSRSKPKVSKRTNQCDIRPSVICENTSYIAKSPSGVQKEERKAPSPVVICDDEQSLREQYSTSMVQLDKLRRSKGYENVYAQMANKEARETTVLRENSSTRRPSHVAPQPIPVYNAPFKYGIHHHPVLSGPEVFVSRIYGPENIPQNMVGAQNSTTDEDMYSSDGILNLSLRSNASDPPSR